MIQKDGAVSNPNLWNPFFKIFRGKEREEREIGKRQRGKRYFERKRGKKFKQKEMEEKDMYEERKRGK